MPQKITEFKELAGKTIARVTVTNESDFRSLDIRCTDGTELSLGLNPQVEIEPELLDWKSGDSKVREKYPVIREREG